MKRTRITTTLALCIILVGFVGFSVNFLSRTSSPSVDSHAGVNLDVDLIGTRVVTDERTSDKLLEVDVAISNLSPKQFAYDGWNSGPFGHGARLSNASGNVYKRHQSGLRAANLPKIPYVILPNVELIDTLVFRVPNKGETQSDLTLMLRHESYSTTLRITPLGFGDVDKVLEENEGARPQ